MEPPKMLSAETTINFNRAGWRTVVVGGLLTGFFATAASLAAIFPDRFLVEGSGVGTRVMAVLCALLFGLPFLAFVFGAPRMVRSHGLVIDPAGIRWFEGSKRQLIPWGSLRAVGVGFMVNPAPKTSGNLVALRQSFALELFPVSTIEVDVPAMRHVEEAAPHPLLPPGRYRISLPPFAGVPDQVEQAVRAYAPQLWVGQYQRAWHAINKLG